MDIKETGQKIAKLRHNNKITQEELANKIGVSSQAVSKWERGLGCPDVSLLPALSEQFEIPFKTFQRGQYVHKGSNLCTV